MGLEGAAHILVAVTGEEHTGGIPNKASVIEAVQAAKIAAHVIDLHVLNDVEEDRRVVECRVKHKTCIYGQEARGCNPCGEACPLWNVPCDWRLCRVRASAAANGCRLKYVIADLVLNQMNNFRHKIMSAFFDRASAPAFLEGQDCLLSGCRRNFTSKVDGYW
jgi:hypothetical protein